MLILSLYALILNKALPLPPITNSTSLTFFFSSFTVASSSCSSMQNQGDQPPPGYPANDQNPPTEKKKKKINCWPANKPKGDRGFIEGCLFALCCCWLCEVCF